MKLAAQPLVTMRVASSANPSAAPREVSAVLGAKSVDAVGPLEHAVAYAGYLVRSGWAANLGVMQADEGWKLVELVAPRTRAQVAFDGEAAGSSFTTGVRRHSYDLVAFVGANTVATWQGRDRVAELLPN